MSPSKQNLFLFLEENEILSVIERKLVKLYVNRCVIDENANIEIIGVYELQKVTDLMINYRNPLFKTNAGQRTHKEAVDRDILSDALEKARLHETSSIDNHFIIGSLFHQVVSQNRLPKLLDWLLNEVKYQEMNSLYVTFLMGIRTIFITKESHKNTYEGRRPGYLAVPVECDIPIGVPTTRRVPFNSSVNDDFELTIKLIQNERRLRQSMPLFLHRMLNPYQLKLKETKDETFLRAFTSQHLDDPAGKVTEVDVPERELNYFPNSDPSLRYSNCLVLRQSFHLKSP